VEISAVVQSSWGSGFNIVGFVTPCFHSLEKLGDEWTTDKWTISNMRVVSRVCGWEPTSAVVALSKKKDLVTNQPPPCSVDDDIVDHHSFYHGIAEVFNLARCTRCGKKQSHCHTTTSAQY
jgi:hypothetical protein